MLAALTDFALLYSASYTMFLGVTDRHRFVAEVLNYLRGQASPLWGESLVLAMLISEMTPLFQRGLLWLLMWQCTKKGGSLRRQ